MAVLRAYSFLVIASAVTLFANALPQQDISTFVTNKYLGNINPDVTEKKILNAFVRKKPNLPVALRDTKDRTKLIHTSAIYHDGQAIIDVSASTEYTDKQIIDAFLSANNNLATKANHLRAVLKVRRQANRSASVYADPPQATIIGNSVVSW